MSVARLVPPPGPHGLDVLRFFGGSSFAATRRYSLCATTSEPNGIAGHATLRPARPIVLRARRRD